MGELADKKEENREQDEFVRHIIASVLADNTAPGANERVMASLITATLANFGFLVEPVSLRSRVAALEDALRISKQETERAHLARIESQNPGIDMDRVKRERRYLLDAEWHYCVDVLFLWLAFWSPIAKAAALLNQEGTDV